MAQEPEGVRERTILELRGEAKARTRDWIARQLKSTEASRAFRTHPCKGHVTTV